MFIEIYNIQLTHRFYIMWNFANTSNIKILPNISLQPFKVSPSDFKHNIIIDCLCTILIKQPISSVNFIAVT